MDATTSKHMNKTKSIYISGCKPFHNTKRHKFYTFYLKNAPHQYFLKCAYLHICYSNHAYMHSHCIFVFYFFNNFSLTSQIIFSLFSVNPLSLLHLTLFHLYLLYTNHQFQTNHQNHQTNPIDLDLNSSNPYGFLKSKSQIHQTHLQNHIIKPIYKYM